MSKSPNKNYNLITKGDFRVKQKVFSAFSKNLSQPACAPLKFVKMFHFENV